MIDTKSKLLIDYVIRDKKPPITSVDLLPWAENNRVLYAIAVRDSSMKNIASIGEMWITKLEKTLEAIENTLEKGKYAVTRTYKYIDYVTFDVDLFVQDNSFKDIVAKFKRNGFNVESHDSSLGGRIPGMQVNLKKDGLLTVDLHQDFTWQRRQFLDPKLVMNNLKKRKIADEIILTPSPEIELILCIADIAHERFNITLLDLIWLKGLSGEIKNWGLIFEQVTKYKWVNIFIEVSSIINQLSLDIYGEVIIQKIPPKKGIYKLPFFLNLITCWRIYANTFFGYSHFPFISFLYMNYNHLRYLITNKMPYYNPWYTD